jgi:hypothetical protein
MAKPASRILSLLIEGSIGTMKILRFAQDDTALASGRQRDERDVGVLPDALEDDALAVR